MTEQEEPLDLADLQTLYNEVDVSRIDMAVDTGRLAQRAGSSMNLIYTLLVLQLALAAGAATSWALDPSPLKAGIAVLWLAMSGGFGLFAARQRASYHTSDEQLREATPLGIVKGRMLLLNMEIRAWSGPSARAAVVLGCGLSLGALVWGLFLDSALVALSGGAFLLVLVGFTAYGFRVRLPAVRAELADLAELLEGLQV